ncbi:MAG: HNH endonuclease, partial [Candidatus Eisenbacteria bacterium]
AVWKRDQGRCTFEAANGRRCSCRRGLQFDHRKPVAHGGESTVQNVRLLCPKHNQLEAERRLGKELMTRKRAESRQAAAARKAAATRHAADAVAREGNPAKARTPARAPRTTPHDTARDRLPTIKAPHEDQLRATLTAWGHSVSEISIGLCAALRLPPEAGYDARLDAALEALRRRGAA